VFDNEAMEIQAQVRPITNRSAKVSGNATVRIDRRIQKTKRGLSQALVELILEKGYEQITVQDILDRANVGRSTFYAHYENKELLLVDGPKNLGLNLFGHGAGHEPAPGRPMGFRRLFEHVGASLPLAKATLGKKSGDVMLASFRAQIAHAIRDHYKKKFRGNGKEQVLQGYRAQSAAAAVASLVASWVDDNMAVTVDEISDCCASLVENIFEG